MIDIAKYLQEKVTKIKAGELVILSDADFDILIEHNMVDDDFVSIPNPNQVGILDCWLGGSQYHPVMQNWRKERGIE